MADRETQVRKKHEFENSLVELVGIASALQQSELEIALARTADSLHEMQSTGSASASTQDALRLKGELLHSYFELRLEGKLSQDLRLRQKIAKRLAADADLGKYLISKVITFNLPPVPASASSFDRSRSTFKEIMLRGNKREV